MKINEILLEKKVKSSWIDDLSYDKEKGGTWLTTKRYNRSYFFPMNREKYIAWLLFWSKGRFYHYYLKNGLQWKPLLFGKKK